MSEDTAAESAPAPILGPGTWFQPGPATLVRRGTGFVVLVPGVGKDLIEAAWSVLEEDVPPGTLLQRLAETSGVQDVEDLPSVLCGIVGEDGVTVEVKGRTPLGVYDGEGAALVSGDDEEPVAVRQVDGARRVAFGDLPPEDGHGGLRVAHGMARVRGMVLMSVDAEQLEESDRAALAAMIEADGRSIDHPAAKEEARRKKEAQRTKDAARASSPPPTATPTSSAGSAPPRPAASAAPQRPTTSPPPSTPAAPAAPAAAEPNVFEDLFADAPPEGGDEQPTDESPSATAPQPAAAPAPEPAAAPASRPAPDPQPSPEPAPA
ncbi:MAG: hypothetical protein Q4G40_12250, partial [Brachybacterium sp.]|nr:hypothetical protein [Brachybacterium sp.]